jgi:hypothetical protein
MHSTGCDCSRSQRPVSLSLGANGNGSHVIRYKYGGVPIVSITSPLIEPSPVIHMYGDRSLCLYFPEDDRWKVSDDVHKKIVPWVAEWLVFYELYLLTGKWLGPEAPDPTPPKNPEQVAVTESAVIDRRYS